MLHDIARQGVRDDIARAERFIRDKLDLAMSRPGVKARDRRGLERMTDDISSLALSQFAVCEASALAMVDALLAHFDEYRDTKHFRYWLGTFCFDDGVIQIDDGFLSQADIERVKLKVYKALHEYGVHAIYKVEVEILLRLEGEDSARLMYHVHAACWRHGDPIKPRKLASAMMRGRRFTNDLDAPTVTFRTNRRPRGEPGTSLEPSKKRLPPTNRSVAGLAAYITKWPVCVKVLKPNQYKPGRNRMEADQTKNSAAFVLRLTEALSRISVFDAVGGVGEGKLVRKAWKKGMMDRLAAQSSSGGRRRALRRPR